MPNEPYVLVFPQRTPRLFGRKREWTWHVVGANGEIVIPPEGHRDSTDAVRALHEAAATLNAALEGGHIQVG